MNTRFVSLVSTFLIIIMLTSTLSITPSKGSTDIDDELVQVISPTMSETRDSGWTDPSMKQVRGDSFNERAIFVAQDDRTYLDDLLYVSAIPAAVHWEGATRYDSMIISDDKIRENGNLIGDYSEYLRKIGAEPDIDLIGSVDNDRMEEIQGYFTDVDDVNTVTTTNDVYRGSADIAQYYWKTRRDIGIDTAVLSFVPQSSGGLEVREVDSGTHYQKFSISSEIDAEQTPWVRFAIDWDDPQANTDYRIGMADPYALHPSSYTNQGEEGHVNPTNNKLFDHRGYGEIGLSPYYSFMPHSIDGSPQFSDVESFTGVLPPGDGSIWPLANGTDHHTYTFGPVNRGDYIGIVTNWTYYNEDLETFRDFNAYVYRPDDEVGPGYHLEVAHNDYSYQTSNRVTPESGYCYSDRDGYYKVTIHPFNNSVGGTYHTSVYWGTVDKDSIWHSGLMNPVSDPVEHRFLEYQYLSDDVIESVTNGAVTASLNNIPLMYTAGGYPEEVLVDALENIGIENLILIDPGNNIKPSGWRGAGFQVEHIQGDVGVFNYIYDISQQRGLDKSLVVSAQGGPWFSGAALGGAYHGAPVPSLDDDEIKWVKSRATAMWWQVIQDETSFQKAPQNRYSNPTQSDMEDLSDDIYSWLEGFHPDYNPFCGDLNRDGIPDNGKNWDYSDDIDVLIVSPMNAIKPVFDRAMSGKASVGRISLAEPEVLWAVMNREMLYWKVGFSQASNPDDPGDSVPVDDHWNRALWTFNTYAHDDDIMDYDAGDQDDDDWCGVDDGGANHLQYKTREDLPSYATASGRDNEYHTYYDNILEALEGGTILWSNHGHGHAYWMLETGPGFTGTGADPSDPPWGTPVPPNGFVDPPLETTSGWDWYYGLDNVHSSFSTYQSCQVGGSALSEYYLRLGGIGVIGGYVTRSLVEATIQSDRTTQGLFIHNMTFGDAHRWGQDETGCMYSLKDDAVPNRNYQEYGFPDDVVKRYGDTGHTILYGDPSLRILAPTLFTSTDIYISEDGTELIVDLAIMDQSGVYVDPDSMVVTVDGEEVVMVKTRSGRFSGSLEIPHDFIGGIVSASIMDEDHLSNEGIHTFTKTYHVHFSSDIELPDYVRYSGGLVQKVRYGYLSRSLRFNDRPLLEYDINEFRFDLYTAFGTYTGSSSSIIWDGEDWVQEPINVSNYEEGYYYLLVSLSVSHYPKISIQTEYFEIGHHIKFSKGELNFGTWSKVLTYSSLEIRSSYLPENGTLPEIISYCTYEIFSYDGSGLEPTDVGGEMVWNVSSSTYEFERYIGYLPLGDHKIVFEAGLIEGPTCKLTSEIFSIEEPARASSSITYLGRMKQLVYVEDIRFHSSPDTNFSLTTNQIMSGSVEILDQRFNPTGLSNPISKEGDGWSDMIFNVSILEDGEYHVQISVSTISFGSSDTIVGYFVIDHLTEIHGPRIDYDIDDHTLDITDIRIVSSYLGSNVMLMEMVIKDRNSDVIMDLTNQVVRVGDTFFIKDLNVGEHLPEGDSYYLDMEFWVDGEVLRKESDNFLVKYELTISVPNVTYDPESDVLSITKVLVMIDFDEGVHLNPSEVKRNMLMIFNASTDELLLLVFMEFSSGFFYVDIPDVIQNIGEGEVYAVAGFSSLYSDHYEARSETIDIRKPVDDRTPMQPEDPDKDKGLHWTFFLAIILIILVVVMIFLILSAYIIKSRKRPVVEVSGFGIGPRPPALKPAERLELENLPPQQRPSLPEVEYLRPGSKEEN